MAQIKNINRVVRIVDNVQYVDADIIIGGESDLPESGNMSEYGIQLIDGSIAWDVTSGTMYGLYGGTWHKQDGTAANAAGSASSLASHLLKQGKSTMTEDEPEQVEPDELDTESEVTEDER